jgi:signal transduction histidine kinase/DNA-binding LacI/PurR family transcriptional regulator
MLNSARVPEHAAQIGHTSTANEATRTMMRSDRRGPPRPVIGVFQRDPVGMYAEQWLGGVDAAYAHGCDLISFLGHALEEPGFQGQANAIYDLATGETLDGLVVWTTALGFHLSPERMTRFCRRFGPLPMVTVEQPADDAPVVLMGERQGMDEAVRHLIEVHGYRRIAFVRGARTHAGAQRRYQGYLDAMARHGLPVPPELVSAPLDSLEQVASSVTALLRQRPEAIATAHDNYAVCILSTLVAAGVDTPGDVAVVGFDDRIDLLPGGALDVVGAPDEVYFGSGIDWTARADRWSNVTALSLTTVRAPFYEMGRRAVELVLGLIRGESVPRTVEIPTQLVVRHTCGCTPEAPAEAVSDLATALQDQTAQLPKDWAQQLSSAFLAALDEGSDGEFRALLTDLVRASLWSGERVEHWWRILAALRGLAADPAGTRVEELLRYAQTLLSETAEKYWRYREILAEKRGQIARDVGQELITATDRTGVAEALARQVPRLGIPGCHLAAYEPPPSRRSYPALPDPAAARTRSRLLLAYEDGVRVEAGTDAPVYPSVRLVPGELFRGSVPSSRVALPLYFHDQQLGYVLFELGPRIGWIYTTLQDQLSSALHRASLIETDRAAMAAVEEAHRQAERHRLAAEMHDSISQALFSMTLHTRALELAVQQDGVDLKSRLAHGLGDLRDLTQTALAETRALILQMRPESLHEEGLVATLRRHITTVAAREGLAFGFHSTEQHLPLVEEVEKELFRVVQEAVHNSVKHARARRIQLSLSTPADPPGTLLVEIADDGTGFDPDQPRPGHLGLNIMRERVERIGGRLTVDSSPDRSTTVRAVLPGVLVHDGADAG